VLADEIPDTSLWAALLHRESQDPECLVLSAGDHQHTVRTLRMAAEKTAKRLAARGFQPGNNILIMLPNSIDMVVLLLAVARLGGIWVAIAPDTSVVVLSHIMTSVDPDFVIAPPANAETIGASEPADIDLMLFDPGAESLLQTIAQEEAELPDIEIGVPDHVRAIVFTSGTTGPPKGTLVTERMLVASAWGTGHAADAIPSDRFLLWEPVYHIGGVQLVTLALILPIRLFLVPRFSASSFWSQVREFGITKIHYLGGILEILLSHPATPTDRHHQVKLAFGAGARPEVWTAFETRFAVPLREVYGLTEASSFSTINSESVHGSIGKVVPWSELELQGSGGRAVAAGQTGEIVLRTHDPRLMTPGYLNDPVATSEILKPDGLHTGDLARMDTAGNVYFVGRKRDAIRRRGEMISAWEVESMIITHPCVAECAAVAIPAEVGEEEILIYICPAAGSRLDLREVAAWSSTAMPARIFPRYWRLIDEFPRTPSARIAKPKLPRNADDALDASTGI
jgi:crotonobetaine/carnitine-CoA ligase